MRFCIVLLSLVFACSSVAPSGVFAADSDRPNILFVMTDDQAPWALGLSGHPDAKTPNMDRLGREGAYFPNAFCVTPVCSPSRASILTSRYGSEFCITDWINPRVETTLGLDPAAVTWPKLLQQAGYKTGLVGKWHLGTEPKYHPQKNGFDEFAGFLPGGTTPKDPELEIDGVQQKVSGYTYDILTDKAIEFVRNHSTQPFALLLHFRAPHGPYLPQPDADSGPFQSLDPKAPEPGHPELDMERAKKLTRDYLGSVAGVDRNLGRLLQVLDDLNLTKNTLVIFTSDHGYNVGHHGVWHKGNAHWILTTTPPSSEHVPAGRRPNMFDSSLRVPLVVRWPTSIKAGTITHETVTHLDWLPTILTAAGVTSPQNTLVRGRSLLPLFRQETVDWNNDLYTEYSMHHGAETHMRSWRTKRWKLVRDFLDRSRDEFYDLQEDPGEARNLIDDTNPEVRQAIDDLHKRIVTRMRDIGDPVFREVADLSHAIP